MHLNRLHTDAQISGNRGTRETGKGEDKTVGTLGGSLGGCLDGDRLRYCRAASERASSQRTTGTNGDLW